MASGSDSFNSGLFMEEIQKYECLYNKLCKDYKNKFIRLNCLEESRGKVSGYSRRSGKEVQVYPHFIRTMAEIAKECALWIRS